MVECLCFTGSVNGQKTWSITGQAVIQRHSSERKETRPPGNLLLSMLLQRVALLCMASSSTRSQQYDTRRTSKATIRAYTTGIIGLSGQKKENGQRPHS